MSLIALAVLCNPLRPLSHKDGSILPILYMLKKAEFRAKQRRRLALDFTDVSLGHGIKASL